MTSPSSFFADGACAVAEGVTLAAVHKKVDFLAMRHLVFHYPKSVDPWRFVVGDHDGVAKLEACAIEVERECHPTVFARKYLLRNDSVAACSASATLATCVIHGGTYGKLAITSKSQ